MRYPFADNKPMQALTIISVILLLMIVGLVLSLVIVRFALPVFFGVPDAMGFIYSQAEQIKNPPATLFMQALTSSIGFFLFPAVMFHFLFDAEIMDRMGLSRLPSLKFWLVAIVTMIAAGIFTQVLVQLSEMIPLPSSIQFMRSTGQAVDELIDSFFKNLSPQFFIILTLVMALLPAISEEAFFRGTVQNIFIDFNFTPIRAVVISGLVFAVVHLEFNNFLGIWCMGIVLGLLYYYTGSLWVSITAHFMNNFMVVAAKYAYLTGTVKSDIVSSDTLPLYYTIPAGVIMVGGLVILSKWGQNSRNYRIDRIY